MTFRTIPSTKLALRCKGNDGLLIRMKSKTGNRAFLVGWDNHSGNSILLVELKLPNLRIISIKNRFKVSWNGESHDDIIVIICNQNSLCLIFYVVFNDICTSESIINSIFTIGSQNQIYQLRRKFMRYGRVWTCVVQMCWISRLKKSKNIAW